MIATAAAAKPFKSGRATAIFATVCVLISQLVNALLVLSEGISLYVVPDWETRMADGDLAVGLIAFAVFAGALLATIVWVVTAAAFLVWLHGAVRNVRALGSQTWVTPRMAVLCWFVPILHLFRPYQVVKSVYRGSQPEAAVRGDFIARYRYVLPLWWAAWVVAGCLGNVSLRYSWSTMLRSPRRRFGWTWSAFQSR
ncbi:MAG TPA: DUF4328 domain-containing protein [Polyangiaceae bacterium]